MSVAVSMENNGREESEERGEAQVLSFMSFMLALKDRSSLGQSLCKQVRCVEPSTHRFDFHRSMQARERLMDRWETKGCR